MFDNYYKYKIMVKKKKVSKNPLKKQKSRAQYPYLPELKVLIEQANLVPIGIKMPDFETEIRIEFNRLIEEKSETSPTVSIYEFLRERIKHLPREFLDEIDFYGDPLCKEYSPGKVKQFGFRGKLEHDFIQRYVEYCDMRDSMIALVDRLKTEEDFMRLVETIPQQTEKVTLQNFRSLDWENYPLSIKTTPRRDDKGNLQLTGLAALIGEFDDRRLRLCEVCKQRIFWAKREDSKTCSPKCLNVFNVRRYRNLTDEEKAKKKARREANREYKQKLKQLKEKKNGTL